MHKLRIALAFVILAFVAAIGAAAYAASDPVTVVPGREHWTAQPGNYSMALLYGNPSKDGFYVMRLKLPPNWTFPAHYHPGRENVTILSGTFYAGLGSKFDKSALKAYPAGSFISLPPKVAHYAATKAEGAVIQLEGIGPFADVMIKK